MTPIRAMIVGPRRATNASTSLRLAIPAAIGNFMI
jgi:hypothetical protein